MNQNVELGEPFLRNITISELICQVKYKKKLKNSLQPSFPWNIKIEYNW